MGGSLGRRDGGRGNERTGRQAASECGVCTQHAGESARGAQRTENMWFMSVTREVSQPEMSALKLPKLSKSRLMSVTPETHQPAMAPYFAVAAAAFELNSVAAVFRSALSAKVCPVQAGGGEGEGGGGTALAAITASWTSIAYRFPCIDLSGNTLLGILNR